MAEAIILQQVEFEGPRRIASALARGGYTPHVVRLFAGERVPLDLSSNTPLVLMGGPMGVSDVGSDAHPFLADEVELLRRRLSSDAPTLGICLGAQLMAFAAGARVYENARPASDASDASERVFEVGWADLHFDRSEESQVLVGIADVTPMFHWHGDTFDLPAGARLFASTKACRAQAFRLNRRWFGLQFHPEVEPADIEGLLRVDAAYAVAANGPQALETIRRDTERFMPELRAVGDRLLDNVVRALA
jgi:GMP synthase-like glutamine amidotransferase